MRIVSIYDNFRNEGGAQDTLFVLAENLNTDIPIVLTQTRRKEICDRYKNKNILFEHLTINNIIKYNSTGTVFISHVRKLTTFLMVLNKILVHKIFIVHVAHSVFTNLKHFTIFPKNIIAVSNAVRKNLADYFGISDSRITVIYNGVGDVLSNQYGIHSNINYDSKIKILLAARICRVKQQVELVIRTKGFLNTNIEFYFAGEGDEQELLRNAIGQCSQYKMLGHIDVRKEMDNYDYVCLFSQKEGLPISLIEGCMFGKPLLTNDVDAILEVNEHKNNGFVVKNWKELIECINKLPDRSSDEYKRLASNSRKKYETFFILDKMLDNYRMYLNAICAE
jgi:glycosyltransferase involved in cell wall biosynthesis